MKKTWKELFPDALLGENGQDTLPVTLNGEGDLSLRIQFN